MINALLYLFSPPLATTWPIPSKYKDDSDGKLSDTPAGSAGKASPA
jgi:hypothetical protein